MITLFNKTNIIKCKLHVMSPTRKTVSIGGIILLIVLKNIR